MRQTQDLMGMPITVEVIDDDGEALERVFEYFRYIDETFSLYKPYSEITRINHGLLTADDYSEDMRTVLALAEDTKRKTSGYFNIQNRAGMLDPSGIVKGWAINNAAEILRLMGCRDFYVEAGGDIQVSGVNEEGHAWRIGIRDPKAHEAIVKVIEPGHKGVATSGTAARGEHIWNPHTGIAVRSPYLSITVIGPDVCEADRFATAAFAMGEQGMAFLEKLPGFEAYAIDRLRTATKTSGFAQYEVAV